MHLFLIPSRKFGDKKGTLLLLSVVSILKR